MAWCHQTLTANLVKSVVVERHKPTGNIGKGLVRGLGLKRGALATLVAHTLTT